MLFLSQSDVDQVADWPLVMEAVRQAFLAQADDSGYAVPVVLGRGQAPDCLFGVKTGGLPELGIHGVKIAAYWPANRAQGKPAHSSNTILLDERDGHPLAWICGDRLNCLRTAAADAVAVDALARLNVETLAIIGTGHQARFELEAVSQVRRFKTILVAARQLDKAHAFAASLPKEWPVKAVTIEQAVQAADVLITATPAKAPVLLADWVQSGAHISAMGADAPGKRELPDILKQQAQLFADWPQQSTRIGEFEHLPDPIDVTALGDVLAGRRPGRICDSAITVFDSSGLALQDVAVAQAIYHAATARGLGQELSV